VGLLHYGKSQQSGVRRKNPISFLKRAKQWLQGNF
jgi:hypothetical protein